MRIKAIIVDLDKTLLHTDKSISSYTVEVLKKCQNKGIKVLVATARPSRAIQEYLKLIEFDVQTVSNGARIICGNQKKEYGIQLQDAANILNELNDYQDLKITLETGDCAYSNLPIEEYETIISDKLIEIAKEEGTLKILVHIEQDYTLQVVKESLPQDVYYTIAHGTLIQIMNNAATKWNGVKTMLEFINCAPEEAVYFGDDYDDIESISKCGVGVVVENGIDEVKNVADFITATNDSDGVAKWIEANVLTKLG